MPRPPLGVDDHLLDRCETVGLADGPERMIDQGLRLAARTHHDVDRRDASQRPLDPDAPAAGVELLERHVLLHGHDAGSVVPPRTIGRTVIPRYALSRMKTASTCLS